MLNISKPLNAGQAASYHKLEYTSDQQTYYKEGNTVKGEWQGQLATGLGLTGEVTPEEFSRLAEGQHPQTGQQMVKHRAAMEYDNADGSTTKAVEHRAGWDATFSAPKSVSLTALVGGDDRVREAHREAVTVALQELERYTQARIGGNNPAETTGQFIAAKFEHDTARPVDGYAAPQLHTHAVIFNMTERADGTTRALEPRAFFDAQNYATAVYQSTLMYKLRDLGYEIEAGRSGAPEIKGYSTAYLDASSPRSQQIQEEVKKSGYSGPEAAELAAISTRDRKLKLTPEEVSAAHQKLAAEFGNEAGKVVQTAREQAKEQTVGPEQRQSASLAAAREAVTFARNNIFEREAVADERLILRDAMRRGMGEASFADIRAEVEARHEVGQLRSVQTAKYATGRSFTTPETIAAERANIGYVQDGRESVSAILPKIKAEELAATRDFLNASQKAAIVEVLTSRDRVHALQGLPGAGKTTTLEVIREGAEASGYTVQGFAPTARAAGQLRDAGIEATTLQSFLARTAVPPSVEPAPRHVYILDESSLASSRQMRAFLDKVGENDRVLLVGDTRQHQGVDAGRPFQQMQEAGMQTSRLDTIVRQKVPALLEAVRQIATGEIEKGISMLAAQGRVTEIKTPAERVAAIARDYAADPASTLIVSPDNRSRQAINEEVRIELRKNGTLAPEGQQFQTLATRNDLTGTDRTWAAKYAVGDVLQYSAGSKQLGIERDSFAVVRSVDARANTLTVALASGESATYDPRRLRGVTVYQEKSREFATGDRVQFTTNNKELGVHNRDLGAVMAIAGQQVTVRMDGKDVRVVTFDATQFRQFDHGYAVTSHSGQGLTSRRTIVNVDTESSRVLINNRLAAVALSRGSHDVRIYTNDAGELGVRLAAEVTKTSALEVRPSHDARPLELREAVEAFAKNETVQGIALLEKHGRLHQYTDLDQRLAAIVSDYANKPNRTVIVAPDATTRQEITPLLRQELKERGLLAIEGGRFVPVLTEQTWNRNVAENYAPRDTIHFRSASEAHGINRNSSATVVSVDQEQKTITVKTDQGKELTYNPSQLKETTSQSKVYRPGEHEIVAGERVLFTAPDAERGIRARDFATVQEIGDKVLSLKLDSGKTITLDPSKPQRLDYGYAVDGAKPTSAQRVLISVEGVPEVHNESAVYRALVRASHEATVYTSERPSVALPRPVSLAQLPSDPTPLAAAIGVLRSNQIERATEMLQKQGRIHEHAEPAERRAAVVADFIKQPGKTVIVAPDRADRKEITDSIRAALKEAGTLSPESRSLTILTQPEINSRLALHYAPGDTIQYRAGSEEHGITRNSAAVVTDVNIKKNLITVEKLDGEQVTYNPALLRSATRESTVYRPEGRDIAWGDRIQFTKADRSLGIKAQDFATVERIHGNESLAVRLDNGKALHIDANHARHIEHGYVIEGTKAVRSERVVITLDSGAELQRYSPAHRFIVRASQDAAVYISGKNGPSAAPQIPLEVPRDQALPPARIAVEAFEKLPAWATDDARRTPINKALNPAEANQFDWRATFGTIESYRHIQTGKHIHIDRPTGEFYNSDRLAIGRQAALQHAMPDPLQANLRAPSPSDQVAVINPLPDSPSAPSAAPPVAEVAFKGYSLGL